MSFSVPQLASVEFGVERFLMKPDHFNEPCKLFDTMTEDVEICAAGVFIGELSHLEQHTSDAQLHQVNKSKSFIMDDRDLKGVHRNFMPVVQERACLWDEFGSLSITPQEPTGRAYLSAMRCRTA
ncbi:Mycosubtilin synthase subunit A, partial [Frankliniella fusca]